VGKINDSLQRSHEGAAKEEGKAQEAEQEEEVVKPATWRDMKKAHFKPYTAEEKAKLQSEYSPEQLAAIEAGESAIKPEELAKQFSPRDDPWKFQYLDDFSTIEPVVDHHIRAPLSNYDPNSRLKTEEDFVEDLAKYVENMTEDPSPVDFLRFTDNLRLTTGKEEAERNPHSALVPDIMEPGETLETVGRFKPQIQELAYEVPETTASDVTPELRKLMLTTGYDEKFIKSLRIKSLVFNSVANQTRLGKVRKTLILSIAGNGKGLLGLGEGKGEEMGEAQTQSQYRAIRNMQPILRYENRTIFGDLKAKVGGTPVVLMHKPPGRWIHSRQFFTREISPSNRDMMQDLAFDASTISMKCVVQSVSMTLQQGLEGLAIPPTPLRLPIKLY
jgi:small subunit ribosomal protein S5